MIRTNLSTRPFYNERAVRGVLTGLAAVLAVLLAVLAYQIIAQSRQVTAVSTQVRRSEARAADFLRRAQETRRRVDQAALKEVAAAAREANLLIDRRTFSWTALFNQFEATLPDGVRIAAVRPSIEQDGSVVLFVEVVAREVNDIETFIERLEATGNFRGLLSREEQQTDDGLIKATLVGGYVDNPAAAQTAALSAGRAR